MTDEGTTVEAPEAGATESGPEVTQGAENASNPAWAELRSSLGDTMFKLAEPHLTKFDKAAEGRISGLNSQLKDYSALGDVQTLRNYQTLAQQLDSNPLDFYNRLQAALTERGLLEQAKAVQEQAEQLEDDGTDPRIAQLQQEQERIQSLLEQQDLERQTAQQATILQREIASMRSTEANKWMSDADEQQVVDMAHALVVQGQANSIEQAIQRATASYTEIRNRFMSTPRAAESAPKLPGVGGGNPSVTTQDLSKASRGETQNLVAAYLKAAQGQ